MTSQTPPPICKSAGGFHCSIGVKPEASVGGSRGERARTSDGKVRDAGQKWRELFDHRQLGQAQKLHH